MIAVSDFWPFNGIRSGMTRGIAVIASGWVLGWVTAKAVYLTGLGAAWLFPIIGIIFDCPAGSSFNAHIHVGPGEYLLTKGRIDVRAGAEQGGDTVVAPACGYESANARHDKTYFAVDPEFYMTFLGPLAFIKDDGPPIVNVLPDEAQRAYAA